MRLRECASSHQVRWRTRATETPRTSCRHKAPRLTCCEPVVGTHTDQATHFAHVSEHLVLRYHARKYSSSHASKPVPPRRTKTGILQERCSPFPVQQHHWSPLPFPREFASHLHLNSETQDGRWGMGVERQKQPKSSPCSPQSQRRPEVGGLWRSCCCRPWSVPHPRNIILATPFQTPKPNCGFPEAAKVL